MSKSLALLALGALLAVPAVAGQVVPAHTVTVSIEDLAGSATVNDTVLALPFHVVAAARSTAPCLAGTGASYSFTLTAELINSTGNNTTVEVSPTTFMVSGPGAQPGTVTRTTAATLLVHPGPYVGDNLSAQVRVTAASTPGTGGCPGGAQAAAATDTQDVNAGFLPPQGFGTPVEDAGQEMPAFPTPLLLVALAALVLVVRRK